MPPHALYRWDLQRDELATDEAIAMTKIAMTKTGPYRWLVLDAFALTAERYGRGGRTLVSVHLETVGRPGLVVSPLASMLVAYDLDEMSEAEFDRYARGYGEDNRAALVRRLAATLRDTAPGGDRARGEGPDEVGG